jgi:predicted nucleotidyltransferase
MEKIERSAKSYQLELILIFGSQAQAQTQTSSHLSHPESDLDIAFYGNQILSEIEKINLTTDLCNLFHTDKVDLVDIKTAPPLLKKEIFKNYKVLYQKDPILLYQLELVSIYEFLEADILYQIRHERLQESIG